MISISSILVGIVVLYFVVEYIRGDKLKKFPGPRLASITSLWQLWDIYITKDEATTLHLHRKYGNVVRVSPNKLYFGDVASAKEITNVNRDLRKSEMYRVFGPPAEGKPVLNLFADPDVKYHDAMRRAFGRGFMPVSIPHYEPKVDAATEVLVEQLKSRFADKPDTEGSFDIAQWSMYFALDSISNIAYSKSYGFMEQAADVGNMIRDSSFFLSYCIFITQAPWLDKLLIKNPLLMKLQSMGYLNHISPAVLFALEQQEIRKKQIVDGKLSDKDLLGTFFKAQSDNPEVINDYEVMKMGLAVVLAGADTTASFLSALWRYLLKYPEVYSKLMEELGALPPGLKYTELQQCRYLDAVIKETARVFPVIRFQIERIAPPEGIDLAGHHIPGGVKLGANPWAVQQDPTVFGANADKFIPERWLDPERNKEMSSKLFLFGYGKYQCLGMHMAYMEIYKVVPAVLQAFKMELVDPSSDWKWCQGAFVRVEDLHVKLTSRKA